MKIGIFGGTFDPIHLGHLAVAENAIRHVNLDFVYVVPNDVPPHKKTIVSDLVHRYAMVALACQHESKLIPAPLDFGTSYTINTIKRVQGMHPADQLYYIVGMDSYLDLPNWHQAAELCCMCQFIVSARPGFVNNPKDLGWFDRYVNANFVTQIHMPITATDIRNAIGGGDMVSKYLLQQQVWDYIQKTGLYKQWQTRSAIAK